MSQNDALLQTLLVKQNQILAKLNAFTEDFATSGNAVLDVFFEREFYRDFETGNDFRERFLRLVKGLDQRSVETVVQCLQRVRKICSCSDRYLSLYTAEEQAEYRHMKEHFSRQILQLSGDCCFYDGWMLVKEVMANTNGTTDVVGEETEHRHADERNLETGIPSDEQNRQEHV
jgi:hypothetical protein